MALAVTNADDHAEQMLSLSKRLSGLLARETELFLARTPQLAASFAEEKNNLARIYRNETSRINRDPELLAGASAQIKSELRQATLAFHQALGDNHQAIQSIRLITEGMVKSVASEVAKTRASKGGYGANGIKADAHNTMSAITLDQRA